MSAFFFDPTTDWRINPNLSVDQSVVMTDGKFAKVPDDGQQVKLAREIIQQFKVFETLPTRGAIPVFDNHLRFERMPNGFYALRRLSEVVPTCTDLNIPREIQRLLLSQKLSSEGGIVLILGKAGRGKSFTAAAAICDRLRAGVNDYALTYENPPEFLMQGFHGLGYLDQNSIHEGDYSLHLNRALRCFPAVGNSQLFAGELLDSDSASAFLKIGLSGNVCWATAHGDDPITGISRWLSLCGADQSASVRHSVANALRLVIYQDLERDHTGVRRPVFTPLIISTAAANHIRQGNLHLLSSEIEQTRTKLKQRED